MSNETKVVRFPYSPDYQYVFKFEETFDRDYTRQWMRSNWIISLLVGILYVAGAFSLKAFMKTRTPMKLRRFLIVWNWTLAVFSVMGFARTFPEFFHVLTKYGYHFSVCNRSYADINVITAVWGFLFTLSKVPELLDTAFVLLRKRNLIFLHWYHHFTTLVISWYIYSDHPAMGRWIMNLNYGVHSIMYSYYALRAMDFRPPQFVAISITAIQIIQMIFGLAASLYSAAMMMSGRPCGHSADVVIFLLIVYGSYFALFVNFFVKTYVAKATKTITRRMTSGNITTSIKPDLCFQNVHSRDKIE